MIQSFFGERFQVRDEYPNLRFIHIGKCAGTSVIKSFMENKVAVHQFHHHRPDYNNNNNNNNFKYFSWVRNPINRFVSAFNMSYEIINYEIGKKQLHELNINNCIAPGRVRMRERQGYAFSPRYDKMIELFETPNRLAESLTSDKEGLREKAEELMLMDHEHIKKGIGWYFYNGDFIEKRHEDIIFIGKLENMLEDLEKFSNILGIELEEKRVRINKSNKVSKNLSKKSVNNIIDFYEDTDYKTLQKMNEYGFISDEYLESCYEYNE